MKLTHYSFNSTEALLSSQSKAQNERTVTDIVLILKIYVTQF